MSGCILSGDTSQGAFVQVDICQGRQMSCWPYVRLTFVRVPIKKMGFDTSEHSVRVRVEVHDLGKFYLFNYHIIHFTLICIECYIT